MGNLTKKIREKAERMRGEMKELFQDMENEMRSMGVLIKEKVEKLEYEIKKKIIR